MDKETNEEKHFTENVDRLLAGEEVEGVENADDDYNTAINFAQKLAELRAKPSPDFKGRLKQRLLQQLTRQEAEAARNKESKLTFWEFLANLVPQSPLWRTATATIVVALVAVTVLWRTGMFTTAPASEAEMMEASVEEGLGHRGEEKTGVLMVEEAEGEVEAAPAPGIEIPLQLIVPSEPLICSYGEPAEIKLVFRNAGSQSITIDPFPPAIYITSRSIARPVRLFEQGTSRLELSPSEGQSYTVVWDQRDNNGRQVAPGWYILHGDVSIALDKEPAEIQMGFPQNIELLIQFPQGAMEKVIELNQSQTTNGITITLEEVVLSDLNAAFYAFNVPPDYDLPQGTDLPPPRLMIHAEAEYSLDGGPMKKAGWSAISFSDEGMKHSWIHLDPVPNGTRELTIIITRLGDWEGPWVFTISLQD